MKRVLVTIGVALAVLLSGAAGFLSCWVFPAQQAEDSRTASVVEVDLSRGSGNLAVGGRMRTQVVSDSIPTSEKKAVRVLVYHTHTYEAYEPTEEESYEATERWRTADPAYNVVAVGAALADCLREYGMTVVHDDTAFEPPSLDYAYERSLDALNNYAARGERFDVYIDLHRDAYQSGERNTITVEGEEVARVMFVIGTGEGSANGKAFLIKPKWEENLAYATALTDALNAGTPDLCRAVTVRTGRYNQHISPRLLLLEVGNNRNTLEEALRAVPYVAKAIAETEAAAP